MHGCSVNVTDPYADPIEAKNEYNLELVNDKKINY